MSNNTKVVLVNIVFVIFLLLQYQCHSVVLTWSQNHDNNTNSHSLDLDKASLLQFKRGITEDPFSTLFNWNVSVHVCQFNGVQCDKNRQRVSQLILNDSDLAGALSPSVANLTGLRYLWIYASRLTGTIPLELSRLRHLRSLRLDSNNFHGQIPVSLFHLPKLVSILLLDNNLNGSLSSDFFSNCSEYLTVVDLSANSYYGKIRAEIGNCKNLRSLGLYNNQFTGELPLSLMNTSLLNLDVEYNSLTGELPSVIVENLPELLYLRLSFNHMESHDRNTNLGPFFAALQNCTHLEELELAGMGLGGSFPDSVGQLGVNLTALLLPENRITGSFPSTVCNLSELVVLNLSSNYLNGVISEGIRMLPRLEQLFLSHNFFTGVIPKALGGFNTLGLLDLSHNSFSGEIPESLGNLSRMTYLFLHNNRLSGRIPWTLGQCSELHKLDLSHNRLTGEIPRQIAGISEIRIFINLSHNHLEGPLPSELSKMTDVQEIDLSSNNLTGTIFPQISSCIAASLINFSQNSLQGELPDSIGDLIFLESLDVSGNNLSGKIPTSLSTIPTLTYLNLSFNDFEGEIPSRGFFNSATYLSFLGNPRLCWKLLVGAPLRLCPTHKTHHHINPFHSRPFLIGFIVVATLLVLLLTVFCAFFCGCIKVVSSKNDHFVRDPPTPEFLHNIPRIAYRELSAATEGFDMKTLIGSGSYGRVYKGVLRSNGTSIAVKVLHSHSTRCAESFRRECQVLKMIRHRNLMRIITVCCLPDFKALVFPYMENGSLESHLHGSHSSNSLLEENGVALSLAQRVRICSDVAEGMAYLHHHCPAVVVHGDLKPDNVLLNGDMTALVSDFGTARVLIENDVVVHDQSDNINIMRSYTSNSEMLIGSIGYIPPEYGVGSRASTKGDVYSFGVLVLEMVTGKRPTDEMFVGGLTLKSWVNSHRHGGWNIEKVVDSSLVIASANNNNKVKRIWKVSIEALIGLGILCTQDSPSSRPTMLDVAVALNHLKRCLVWAS